MNSNSQQTALITGASSGIGLQLARLFARDGFGLILVARNQAKLTALAQELQITYKIPVTVLPCDLGDPGAVAELAAQLNQQGLEAVLSLELYARKE